MLKPPSPTATAVIADLARSLEPRLPELADRLADIICATDQVYREQRIVNREQLIDSCHKNLGEHIRALAILPRSDPAYMDSCRATGRRRAEQGLPLENLLHAYRLGGRILWEGLLEECRGRPRPPKDELLEGAVVVWDSSDEYSAEIARAYRQAEEEILSRDKSQRQTLLHSLLTGMATERDLMLASKGLDLPESAPYAVALAENQDQSAAPLRALSGALTARAVRSEWLPLQDEVVGLISLRGTSIDAVAGYLRAAGSFRIGLSPVVPSLSQAAVAYRQAELALRSIPPHRYELASLDSRLPNALLAASPDLAQRLAQHVLGPLFDLSAAERNVLLGTLSSYLGCGGAVSAVANALACHRNTVLNRLSRIEQLTGLSPVHPADAAQLSLALQAVDLLGIHVGNGHHD
ncbi:MAG: helix-turn-helix domain-containing protein [Chloroflexi bacterium]|nr:helix-turn-helix domain-containing protein [Chloroflexota bacterium]